MSRVSQVEMSLKHIMEEQANVLARETGCFERQRKCSGADLLQTLIFGWLSHPDASLETLASVATLREIEVTDAAVHKRFTQACALCWLLGTSVHKIGKLRRDNLSPSTSPSPRDAPPINVRSSKALHHEYESTGHSNKAEGWPVLSACRRKTGRECTNTLSGTPWLHALSIVYAALR